MKTHTLTLLFILCGSLSNSAERKFVQPELIIDDKFTIELAAAPTLRFRWDPLSQTGCPT